ncbi:MAG: hypothetical protein KIS77_08100 [Saprospiraceae bacterium]|nr:hypothetical protein [Saprospiraceae bacterium]
MKKTQLFSLIALMSLATLTNAQNNILKLGIGLGGVAYEGTLGIGGELQYERLLGSGLSVFASAGINGDFFTSRGRSQGSSGGMTWDNSYKYNYSEQFLYVDLGLRGRVLSVGEKYALKLGAGVSAGQAVLRYPKTLFINRGIIEQRVNDTHRAEAILFNFGIDNDFTINPRFVITLRGIFRTTFSEKHILSRVVNYENGTSSSTSGILNVPSVMISFGYLF